MENLRVIEGKTDVRETLERFLKNAEEYRGIVILALDKETSPEIVTSTMNLMEVSFLATFLNAWLSQNFSEVDYPEGEGG